MTQKGKTIDAIVEAAKYPLAIIMVGVGDGPWDNMGEFDDNIPARLFDNFQFVNFHQIEKLNSPEKFESVFAMQALMEIPGNFKKIKDLRLLDFEEDA